MTSVFKRTSRALLVAAPAMLLAACGTAGSGQQKVDYDDKSSIPADKAQRAFRQSCLYCHSTGVGPQILGRGLDPEAVKMFVRNGNRAMPAFPESAIDDQTLDEIAAIVAGKK